MKKEKMMKLAVGLDKFTKLVIALNIVALIGPERVESYVFDWHFDSSFLAIAAILFWVYYIFKYGEVLQQESDETL